MPYIKQILRDEIDPEISQLMASICDAILLDGYHTLATENLELGQSKLDGVMNYVITRLMKGFYTDGVDAGGIPITNYYRVNRAVGVLECAKTEFERKVVAPYEDQKKMENGDVQ